VEITKRLLGYVPCTNRRSENCWMMEVMMKTREIPRDEWTKFFDSLSRRQEGWEVELEVFRPDIGDQIEGCHMYLAGMAAEVSERGDKIQIMLAGARRNHVTHTINAPTLVQLQQTDIGIDSALHIKSADGSINLLHLRSL
jgi:hypothetical protein